MSNFKNPNNPLRRGAAPKQTPVAAPNLNRKHASAADEASFEADGSFNPKRSDGSNDRLYDAKGEMNAYDKKDAFRQTAFIMNDVASRPAGFGQRRASAEEQESQRKVLASAMQSPEGFALVAQEMAGMVKTVLDYKPFGRALAMNKTIGQGEYFRIAKDNRATAYEVGQDGRVQASRAVGNYFLPPEVMISSMAEVSMKDILQISYDVMQRMVDTAGQEIGRQEDKFVMKGVDAVASIINTVSTFTSMSISVLENLRLQVERHGLIADKFLINRSQVSDIQINMSGSADPVTQREWNVAGYVGNYLGTKFMTAAGLVGSSQEVIASGSIYCVAQPDSVGVFGVRMDMITEPYSKIANGEWVKGTGLAEVVAFLATNPRSISKSQLG